DCSQPLNKALSQVLQQNLDFILLKREEFAKGKAVTEKPEEVVIPAVCKAVMSGAAGQLSKSPKDSQEV
ncbi:Hypothetical predicted protein, partial [Marmota monax]